MKQQLYRDTLKSQAEINKDDLAAVHPSLRSTKLNVNEEEVRQSAINAMVPGIHNLTSVGSMPTFRKAYEHKTGNFSSPQIDSNKFSNDPLLAASSREIKQAAQQEPQTERASS